MSMAHTHHVPYPQTAQPRAKRRRPRRPRGLLWLPIAIFIAGVTVAGTWVTYILWPRWPSADLRVDAPSLPIMINGTNFNIPPAAIRNKVQRRPGAQERVDLAFLWPSLMPPDSAVKPAPSTSPEAVDRIFVTITAHGNTLAPIERFNTIYPRYLETQMTTTPDGLTLRPFQDATPYQGEDIIYSDRNPGRFMVRCTRDGAKGAVIGMCLFERRIDQADITIRFPRAWLSDWQTVSDNLEKLIRSLRSVQR
jgi:hypothetical protein